MSRNKYSSAVKLELEKLDGNIKFGLWRVQVKDILIQSGLHKACGQSRHIKGNCQNNEAGLAKSCKSY